MPLPFAKKFFLAFLTLQAFWINITNKGHIGVDTFGFEPSYLLFESQMFLTIRCHLAHAINKARRHLFLAKNCGDRVQFILFD